VVFVILLTLLVLIAGCLLLAIVCGRSDDFYLAHAYATWHANPSTATANALEAAKSHARTITILSYAVLWSLVALDAFAILKVMRHLQRKDG
jgi:hypothetical protein